MVVERNFILSLRKFLKFRFQLKQKQRKFLYQEMIHTTTNPDSTLREHGYMYVIGEVFVSFILADDDHEFNISSVGLSRKL